jgi:AcrR family transcriptional regulator
MSAAPTKSRVDRRTRAARAERRDARAALLAAAAEVFAKRGFRDATVDEIAERAGYSKGAVYWHFQGKEELFSALVDERVDSATWEMIELLESAPPGQDMGPEASRRFVELLRGERELLLLYHDYWSHAVRDPALRRRYARRRAGLRARLGRALKARIEHLGGPAHAFDPEAMATIILSLGVGLAQERLIAPEAVPDALLGDAIVLLYKGIVASAPDVGSLDDR